MSEDLKGSLCPLCSSSMTWVHWVGDEGWHLSTSGAFTCTTQVRVRPEVLRCGSCGHLFANPDFWPQDIDQTYADIADDGYLAMLPAKRKTFSRAARLVERYCPAPAEILEVGSYAGVFLADMEERGYKAQGIEPSFWGVQESRNRGLSVTQGVAETALADLAEGSFDALVSWDVLEHVKDPGHVLGLFARAVRPGGTVILSTLDRSNWFARILGKRWPWVIPMHLHYFDQETVRGMATAHGLVFIGTGPHVHYSTPTYALSRLVGRSESELPKWVASMGRRPIFPVGFGDVRYFAFRRPDVTS